MKPSSRRKKRAYSPVSAKVLNHLRIAKRLDQPQVTEVSICQAGSVGKVVKARSWVTSTNRNLQYPMTASSGRPLHHRNRMEVIFFGPRQSFILSGRAFLAALTGFGSQGWYEVLFRLKDRSLRYSKIRDCEVALIFQRLRKSTMGAGSKPAQGLHVGIIICFCSWENAVHETAILKRA